MVIAFTTLLLIVFTFSNFSSYPVFVCFLQLSDLFFTLNSFHLIFVVQFFILLALLAILFRDRPDPVAVPLTDLNRYVKFFDFLFWLRWSFFNYLVLCAVNFFVSRVFRLRKFVSLSSLSLFMNRLLYVFSFSPAVRLSFRPYLTANRFIEYYTFFLFSYRLFLRTERLTSLVHLRGLFSFTRTSSDFSIWTTTISFFLLFLILAVINIFASFVSFPVLGFSSVAVDVDHVSTLLSQELLLLEWTSIISADVCSEEIGFDSTLLRYLVSFFQVGYTGTTAVLSGYVDSFFQWHWFNFGNASVILSFKISELETIMFGVVLLITCLVLLYSVDYMGNDPRRKFFLSHIIIFSIFMCIFIASNDLITVFIGWEGVGLSSFFLINFWFTRIQANKAAFKAILVNKIGDSALLIAIALSVFVWKTTSFSVLFEQGYIFLAPDFLLVNIAGCHFTALEVFAVCIVIAAMAKSAQIGLHTWLPDAMEGPTPVSALIHAATMVTAGVLLLIKCFAVFSFMPFLSICIATIGILTSVFAGSVACVQHDIKKIIAYSTCSQLGLMFMACGFGYPFFAFFHLVTHAFFKALLFLAAGSVIHAIGGSQDIRTMGGLARYLPITNMAFLFGNLCIVGFPFFSGFYSKELLVLGSTTFSFFFFVLCLLSTALTAFYSCRLYWCVMLRPYAGPFAEWSSSEDLFVELPLRPNFVCESPWRTQFVLVFLTISSCFVGFLLHDYFIYLSLQDFSYWSLVSSALYFEENISTFISLLPLIVVVLVIIFFFIKFYIISNTNQFVDSHSLWLTFYNNFENRGCRFASLYRNHSFTQLMFFVVNGGWKFIYPTFYASLCSAWFFNAIQNYSVYVFLKHAWFTYVSCDKGIVERFAGSNLIFGIVLFFKRFYFLAAKAHLQQYLFWSLFFLSLLMILAF